MRRKSARITPLQTQSERREQCVITGLVGEQFVSQLAGGTLLSHGLPLPSVPSQTPTPLSTSSQAFSVN